MKNLFAISILSIAMIFLVGCNAPEEKTDSTQTPSAKKAAQVTDSKKDNMMDKKEDNMMMSDLSLSAEAIGDGMVKLMWDGKDLKLGEDDRFILVRSEDENPEHNGLNYWFRQYYTKREATWIDVPTGTMHFRVCVLKGEECGMYSNDVEVVVE